MNARKSDGRRTVDEKKAFIRDLLSKVILLLLGACFSVSAWAVTYLIDNEGRLSKCEAEIPHNKEFRDNVMDRFDRLEKLLTEGDKN